MDTLRSCYSTKMRFFVDSDQEVDVQWYWASPGAKVFPGPHLFASGNWETLKFGWQGPGEVEGAPRIWNNGRTPIDRPGTQYAGPLEGFTEGTVFPGVSVGGQDDGQCTGCSPLCTMCNELHQIPLGAGFYLRITAVHNAPPIPYGHVGDTFLMLSAGGFPDSYTGVVNSPALPDTDIIITTVECDLTVSYPRLIFSWENPTFGGLGNFFFSFKACQPVPTLLLFGVDLPNGIFARQGGSGENWDMEVTGIF